MEKVKPTEEEINTIRKTAVLVVALFVFPRFVDPDTTLGGAGALAFDAAEHFVKEAEARGMDPATIMQAVPL